MGHFHRGLYARHSVDEEAAVASPAEWFVVGLDNGGSTNNATVLAPSGDFLVDEMAETPSLVREGPDKAIEALARSLDHILRHTGLAASALYAHYARFGEMAAERSSVAAIVGTGLGGGVVEAGMVITGAAGMAGELGHIQIPMAGLLAPGQPIPLCNCGLVGDVESVASLTGIERNLLPFWLARFEGHELGAVRPVSEAAKLVRGHGERGDPLALKIFEQQAIALGRLFTMAANFTDPYAYFVGGGVVHAAPHFRDWYLATVRKHTLLREEQTRTAAIALVPDLDMAGARGAAIAALKWLTRAR